ncbi:MAG: trypsin-like peptidase domain-containing protein [Chthoniobacteraceae bacterium]
MIASFRKAVYSLGYAGSLALVVLPRASTGAEVPRDLLHQLDEGFVQVFDKTAPSVVVIDVSKKGAPADEETGSGFDFFFRAPDAGLRNPLRMQDPPARSEGSGIIVRSEGFIVTNAHVVDGAEKLSVKLRDGRVLPGKVVGVDDFTDIAVIKIDATGLPVAAWADSDKVRIGQLVCAIGVPYALEYSFTIGCVSGKGRSGLTPEVTPYEDYLQTSALINPGNSGGPLIDVDGKVVGMNTLVNGLNRGLAFAIPANLIKDISGQLIEKGSVSHPALGIRIETLGADSSLREQISGVEKGAVITTIEPDTPAYKSDLRPADVITAIDGVPVTSAQELRRQVLSKKLGQPVSLNVWRGGKELKISVTTGELPKTTATGTRPPLSEKPANSGNIEGKMGLRLGEIPQANGKLTGHGVRVTEVIPNSPAAIAGIQQDDVITEIDSKPIADLAAARTVLDAQAGKKAVLLFLERKGQKTYGVVKIEN